jgi:hypothetical protein
MSAATITELSHRWLAAYARLRSGDGEGAPSIEMAHLFSRASKLLPRSAEEASTLLCMTMVQLDLEEHESAAVTACRNVLRFEVMNGERFSQQLHKINQRLGNLIDLARTANEKPILQQRPLAPPTSRRIEERPKSEPIAGGKRLADLQIGPA